MNLEAEHEAFKQALIVGGWMALAIAAVVAVIGYALHKAGKGPEWVETCMMVATCSTLLALVGFLWVLVLSAPLYR